MVLGGAERLMRLEEAERRERAAREREAEEAKRRDGSHFTGFTGTKVRILTQQAYCRGGRGPGGRRGCRYSVHDLLLKASYSSSFLRPHTLVASGLIH